MSKSFFCAAMWLELCGAALAASDPGESYDLVILNGRVLDPASGLDAIRNVGVKGGKIAKVTEKSIEGRKSIDATGHVVASGFTDGHVRMVVIPLGQKALLRDGVTTTLSANFPVL